MSGGEVKISGQANQKDMQEQDGGHSPGKGLMEGLMAEGVHPDESAGGAAQEGQDEEIFFGDTPFSPDGLEFVHAHEDKFHQIQGQPDPCDIFHPFSITPCGGMSSIITQENRVQKGENACNPLCFAQVSDIMWKVFRRKREHL